MSILNYVIIDIQGFKGNNNEFIVKELAILIDEYICYNFIIKEPYDFFKLMPHMQRQAKWLTKNHHGLHWANGTSTLSNVRKFLEENLYEQHTIFIVKGVEKKQWIAKYILNGKNAYHVLNVEDFGCASFKNLYKQCHDLKPCNHHQQNNYLRNKVCALVNVKLIYNFLNVNNLFTSILRR